MQTRRRGYLVGVGLIVASIAIGAGMFWWIYTRVEAMPRVDARGTHVVNLPAGDLVVFAELQAGNIPGSARCEAKDASGAVLKLASMGSTSISYDLGSYHGRSVFDLEVPSSGPVTMTCETDTDFTLAFGDGLGKTMAIAVVLSLLSFFSGCFIIVRTFWRRRRERRAANEATLTPV